jgi:hypothetical protein
MGERLEKRKKTRMLINRGEYNFERAVQDLSREICETLRAQPEVTIIEKDRAVCEVLYDLLEMNLLRMKEDGWFDFDL